QRWRSNGTEAARLCGRGESPVERGAFPDAGQERRDRSGRNGHHSTIPNGRPAQGRNGYPAAVLAWKQKRGPERGSNGAGSRSHGANPADRRERGGSGISAVRAGGGSRVLAARRFGGGRSERSASAARRRSHLPRHPVRNAVPVFRTRVDLLPFGERASAVGFNAARTTVDSPDCRGAHEQRNRQSLLPLGANGEKPPLSHEAQDRSGGSPGHRAGLPDARVYAIVFGVQFPVFGFCTNSVKIRALR